MDTVEARLPSVWSASGSTSLVLVLASSDCAVSADSSRCSVVTNLVTCSVDRMGLKEFSLRGVSDLYSGPLMVRKGTLIVLA